MAEDEEEEEEEEEEWEDAAGGNEVEVEVDAEGLASLKELGADGAEAALEDVPLGKRKRGQKAATGASHYRILQHVSAPFSGTLAGFLDLMVHSSHQH